MTAPVRSSTRTTGTVEQVFAVLTSAEWVARRAARFGDGATVVRRDERPDGGLVLAVSRELPEGAPGFLAKLLPADGRVVQTDEWAPADGSGARSGTWRVELPGVPAALGGTLRLDPAGDGVVHLVEGEAKVSVPFVGGRAETFVADMVGRLGAKEGALLQQVLADQE